MSDTACSVTPGSDDTTSRFLALPEDALIRILTFLDPKDIITFGCVCKRFRGPASEERLVWGPVCRSIVGSNAATSPGAWGAPSFQRLYARLLRPYAGLLAGLWCGEAEPLGSLLLAFPSPPYIIGGIVISLRLAEPGVTVAPVFRVSYDSAIDAAAASCLRGANTFQAMLRRVRRRELLQIFVGAGAGAAFEEEGSEEEGEEEEEEAERVHPAVLELTYEEGEGEDNDTVGVGRVAEHAGTSTPTAPLPPQSEPQSGERHALAGEGQATGEGSAVAAVTAAAVDTRSPAGQQRRARQCCYRPAGPKLTQVRFGCSGGCRHLEAEAVCRWVPLGAVSLAGAEDVRAAAAQGAGAAPTAIGGASQAGGSGSGGGATLSGSAGGGGGDACVDLDVLASHRLRERVHLVAVALHRLAVRQQPSTVSYSLLTSVGPRAESKHTAGVAVPPPPSTVPVPTAAAAAPVGADTDAAQPPAGAAEATATAADAGSVDAAAAVATAAAAGAKPVVGVPRALAAAAATHPLEGLWRGTYGGHGIEFLRVTLAGPQLLEAHKLTGDDNVPAGQVSFRIFLDRPGPYADQRGCPFRLPPDFSSRADFIAGVLGAGSEPALSGGAAGGGAASRGGDRGGAAAVARVWDSFEAQGQVAGGGFEDPQWIGAEAVLLGRHTFGVLWRDIHSFSAFQRVNLPSPLPLPPVSGAAGSRYPA